MPNSEVEMNFEISADEFEKYFKEAQSEICKEVSAPGFRPGKVPEKLAKEKIKDSDILKLAAEYAVRETYFPAISEHKIDTIGKPEIMITKIAKGDSFCYRVHTAVLPEIILPDYKQIVRDTKEKSKKEKPAESPEGIQAGSPPATTSSDVGGGGKESEEEAVRKKQIEEIKKKQKIQIEILEAIAAGSQMEIPDVLVGTEKEKMLGELRSSIENMGLSWPDYLGHLKKSEDDLRKDWQADAVRRVKYALILRELAEKENIQVSDEEVEADVAIILKQRPDLDKEYLRGYTYGIIRNEKVFKFLEEV